MVKAIVSVRAAHPTLGAAKAAGLAGAEEAESEIADVQRDRCDPETRRVGKASQAPQPGALSLVVSETLRGESVGLDLKDDGCWIYFGPAIDPFDNCSFLIEYRQEMVESGNRGKIANMLPM